MAFKSFRHFLLLYSLHIPVVALTQFRYQDTSFLMRDVRGQYEAYFIAKKNDSVAYNEFLNLCTISGKPIAPPASTRTMAKKPFSITDYFGMRLYQVHVYKNQFYLYRPTDNIESQYFYLSGKTILREAAGEIDTMSVIANNHFADSAWINAKGQYTGLHRFSFYQTAWPHVLLLGIQDAKSQSTTWSVVVPEDYIRNYPLIVHFSPSQKAFTEFECFDPIDRSFLQRKNIRPAE